MQKFFSHPLVLIGITCIAGVIWLSLEQSAQKADTSQQAIELEQQQTAELHQEISTLQQELELANSPVYKEKMIRDELLMYREGEVVLQIPDTTPEKLPVTTEVHKTPWQEWQEVLLRTSVK